MKQKTQMARTLESIIVEQVGLHPGYAVVDLYKLIHQAVFGVGHLLEDEKEAYRLLSEEFSNVGPQLPRERLFEPIDPKGMLCRVNLRPYKAAGGTLERLFDALLLSQHTANGTRRDFLGLWRRAKKLTEVRSLPFSLNDMERFESLLQNRNLPALHHSQRYEKLNHPAYRVIALGQALGLLEE